MRVKFLLQIRVASRRTHLYRITELAYLPVKGMSFEGNEIWGVVGSFNESDSVTVHLVPQHFDTDSEEARDFINQHIDEGWGEYK